MAFTLEVWMYIKVETFGMWLISDSFWFSPDYVLTASQTVEGVVKFWEY